MSFNVGFVGGGNMSTAIVKGILDKKVHPASQIWVSGPRLTSLTEWEKMGTHMTTKGGELLTQCDVVFLGIKPNMLLTAISDCMNTLPEPIPQKNIVFVSMLAGIPIAELRKALAGISKVVKVIRIMPNMPLTVGAGACLLTADEHVTPEQKTIVENLMNSCGICEPVVESLMDSLGSLVGCGPAYIYIVIEALADGAVKQGVPRDLAQRMAAQTVMGSGLMVLNTGKHPGLLKDEVCSPGGTTITGVAALEEASIRLVLSTFKIIFECSYRASQFAVYAEMMSRGGFRAANTLTMHHRFFSGSVVVPPNLMEFEVANEPILGYLKGSPERCELESELQRVASTCEEIQTVVGGEVIRDGEPQFQVMPHAHGTRIAQYFYASPKTIQKACEVANKAQVKWDRTPLAERVQMWLCAAELMATTYRQSLNAATMHGQSKTVIQAEIDSACELIDFMRFNAYFLKENAKYQPISESPGVTLNSSRFRGMDGFVAAVAPFNFTAISGNIAATPALMGNSVLWKPSDTAILSSWRIFQILREVGVPDGVINFVPAIGPDFGKAITASPYLSGINFTGSVPTFNWLWKEVGKNVDTYRNYPRLIGECGGKNFHFVHPSADVGSVVAGTIRSAYEYQGQKCSACSRMYIPRSLYEPIISGLLCEQKKLKVGDPRDFQVFMGAVIDKIAFDRITKYITDAKKNDKNRILAGGEFDGSKGYFVQPTIIEVQDMKDKLMTEEIFGPVLTIYTYQDTNMWQTLSMVETNTQFALTGAVFAEDERFLRKALQTLRCAAGNFYINDKSTGSVVGQQPFGGAHKSGTNDKAGGPNYVMRWTSPQSIKETFEPLREIEYAYMKD